MTWTVGSPDGALSVKANRTAMNNNNTYIQTTMGNTASNIAYLTTDRDHFWNVDSNLNGHHRFIKSPAYTVGSVPTDPGPALGTGIDGIQYLKTINTRAEWFHRNSAGIYQITPGYLTGTHVVTSSYTSMVAVPASVWGEIFMWRTTQGANTGQTGFFRSDGASVESWALYLGPAGSSQKINLKFGNGADKSGLNIRVRTEEAATGNSWLYRVTYRAI